MKGPALNPNISSPTTLTLAQSHAKGNWILEFIDCGTVYMARSYDSDVFEAAQAACFSLPKADMRRLCLTTESHVCYDCQEDTSTGDALILIANHADNFYRSDIGPHVLSASIQNKARGLRIAVMVPKAWFLLKSK